MHSTDQLTFCISQYAVVFLSFNEPNADGNYADLLTKIPWARRVHGVLGSDAALKAAADCSDTERFIVIDGDTCVDAGFLNQTITVTGQVCDKDIVLSWPSINSINGGCYGNGSVKSWTKTAAYAIRSHEAADQKDTALAVDFCWHMHYMAIDQWFSYTNIHHSAQQAWSAGYREGFKLSLDRGLLTDSFIRLDIGNRRRLATWLSLGNDVVNGHWAMLGARMGCAAIWIDRQSPRMISDLDQVMAVWETCKQLSPDQVLEKSTMLGTMLDQIMEVPPPLSAQISKFVKSLAVIPLRQPKELSWSTGAYDIFYITYNEPRAEENWKKLSEQWGRAVRIDGVRGIHQAHKVAAQLAKTPYFWVIDGDAELVADWDFTHIIKPCAASAVRVWRSINPVNGLVYGHGGVKLLPRAETLDMDNNSVDMTTNISSVYMPIMQVSNVTAFNTDEFSAWRTGFRECAKLTAANMIECNRETQDRISIWCTTAHAVPFSQAALDGAIAGRCWANNLNTDTMQCVNDFDWLREKFNHRNQIPVAG